jgi:hypothetical protein
MSKDSSLHFFLPAYNKTMSTTTCSLENLMALQCTKTEIANSMKAHSLLTSLVYSDFVTLVQSYSDSASGKSPSLVQVLNWLRVQALPGVVSGFVAYGKDNPSLAQVTQPQITAFESKIKSELAQECKNTIPTNAWYAIAVVGLIVMGLLFRAYA